MFFCCCKDSKLVRYKWRLIYVFLKYVVLNSSAVISRLPVQLICVSLDYLHAPFSPGNNILDNNRLHGFAVRLQARKCDHCRFDSRLHQVCRCSCCFTGSKVKLKTWLNCTNVVSSRFPGSRVKFNVISAQELTEILHFFSWKPYVFTVSDEINQ